MEILKEKLHNYVSNYWNQQTDFYKDIVSESEIDNIIDIGISILMTKYPNLGGYKGGSFVQAIVNNDLEAVYGRADYTNRKVVFFYVKLISNFNPYSF